MYSNKIQELLKEHGEKVFAKPSQELLQELMEKALQQSHTVHTLSLIRQIRNMQPEEILSPFGMRVFWGELRNVGFEMDSFSPTPSATFYDSDVNRPVLGLLLAKVVVEYMLDNAPKSSFSIEIFVTNIRKAVVENIRERLVLELQKNSPEAEFFIGVVEKTDEEIEMEAEQEDHEDISMNPSEWKMFVFLLAIHSGHSEHGVSQKECLEWAINKFYPQHAEILLPVENVAKVMKALQPKSTLEVVNE